MTKPAIEMVIVKQPRLDVLVKNARRNIPYMLNQLAYRGRQHLQRDVPVLSGMLRSTSSWAGKGDRGGQVNLLWGEKPLTAVYGVATEYAGYVYYGTSRMPARDFLKSSMEDIKARIKIVFRNRRLFEAQGDMMGGRLG